MEYTIVGFPRIGEHRELKKATESYWKGEIAQTEFLSRAKEQCLSQWERQKESGLFQITAWDFSLYDMMLDTAFLIGAVPKRYKELALSGIDQYFAAARGYQGEHGDVKALTMKKWFNTNYHYIVPELTDETEFALDFQKQKESLLLAKKAGITARSVVIGPFTFLKLAAYQGNQTLKDYVPDIVRVYQSLLAETALIHDDWIQIDEPYLVRDLSDEDVELFARIYTKLLKDRKNRVLLQTYFGDVRDCYQDLMELPFDGIGLDFVEGKRI